MKNAIANDCTVQCLMVYPMCRPIRSAKLHISTYKLLAHKTGHTSGFGHDRRTSAGAMIQDCMRDPAMICKARYDGGIPAGTPSANMRLTLSIFACNVQPGGQLRRSFGRGARSSRGPRTELNPSSLSYPLSSNRHGLLHGLNAASSSV